MPPQPICDRDLTGTAAALAAGELSSRELTMAYLDRIERQDGRLNAYITVTADEALDAAGRSDERRRNGETLGLLDGIPMAFKDNIDVAGIPATAGMATRRNRIPADDAACVAALKAHGAVVLGKHTLHEAAMGPSPINPHYGSTHNAHRHGYTAGGSSTGAGAALAAGLCAAALGTDTLGSVRLPSAYSGISALKPTPGLISVRGVLPLSWQLDVVGPLARSARDLAVLAAALTQYDPEDGASIEPGRAIDWAVPGSPAVDGSRIGRLANMDAVDMEPAVAGAFAHALQSLRDIGCEVFDVAMPGLELEEVVRHGVTITRADAAVIHAADYENRRGELSPGLVENLEIGRRLSAREIVEAGRARDEARLAVRRVLADCDMIALPTAPQVAFPLDQPARDNQPVFTALANMAGCPAVSLPMGMSPDGLPCAIQFMGLPYDDGALLRLASAFEQSSTAQG